jgi:hypothetical protein
MVGGAAARMVTKLETPESESVNKILSGELTVESES